MIFTSFHFTSPGGAQCGYHILAEYGAGLGVGQETLCLYSNSDPASVPWGTEKGGLDNSLSCSILKR